MSAFRNHPNIECAIQEWSNRVVKSLGKLCTSTQISPISEVVENYRKHIERQSIRSGGWSDPDEGHSRPREPCKPWLAFALSGGVSSCAT